MAKVRYASSWSIDPEWMSKALTAARFAARTWDITAPLKITIHSRIPVARGYGSSTADCVAAVRAVANLVSRHPAAEEIAQLVHPAEAASDSTMFGLDPIVFLPLQGAVIRRFSGGWPDLYVSVIDMGGPAVETLAFARPEYSAAELNEFADLLGELEQAFAHRDPVRLGRVSTRSAEIHQVHHPHPAWPTVIDRARTTGAYGVARAHTGTIAALLTASPLNRLDGPAYRLHCSTKSSENLRGDHHPK